jgi:NarL family two-component system response regulator LiaR
VPLVALLHHPDLVAMAMALELGAVRILTLAASADELVSTFEDVRSGAHEEHRQTGSGHDADGLLSVREAEIVAGICRGLSNAEIAGELYLSINSVKTYIRSAYRKMGVTRRSQAVVWGIEHGYRTC